MTKLEFITSHYGKESQINVAIEEMSELTKELCKNKRGFDNREHIVEELSDVFVMLEQLCIIFDISSEDINKVIDFKINRQIQRIQEEQK